MNRQSLIRSLILFTLSCTTVPSFASGPISGDTAPAIEPVSKVSFGDVLSLDVTHQPTLFRYGEAPSQFVELWQPEGIVRPPVVVFIHGGCWLAEYDLSHANAMASAFVDQGFAVWSIEYRRVGEPGGGWPNSLSDVEAAITAMEDFGEQLNLDRAVLSGHSAGGHLALLISAKANYSHRFKQVFGLAPISRLADYSMGTNSCQRATSLFMGGLPTDDAADYRAADPSQRELSANLTLILGADDAIVESSYSLLESVPSTSIPNAGHFDVLHPQTQTFRSFLAQVKEQLNDQ
ncbi:alpha/beta hydrolase [Umboniibacter marinipuniceus]|uniref:Alpha/beta hydrolase family protein n=1 Tax=Umboniibacter marinipuniceus TaxID=569599 RepID=A0A3M0AC87_9GAMM|nr:alpha/beta hydrolase [Umboniibacter marinipuniceus]RMA82540.1 alpha/beta hydrolase family protein [Umboniibacter marinipuniceus]